MTQFISVRVEIEEDGETPDLTVGTWKAVWEESVTFDEGVEEKEACFLARVLAKAVVQASERGKELVVSFRKQGASSAN